MKTIILLLSIFCISRGYTQNYYQTDGALITADGITFKLKLPNPRKIHLDNVNNTKMDMMPVYKDGTICYESDAASLHSIPGGVARAFIETFSKAEFAELQKIQYTGTMHILYIVSPEGDTIEVGFSFLNIPEFQRVPPSKFALLEKNLKKYVKWEVNDFGKQLQFLFGLSFANFSLMELHYPDDPMPEEGDGHLDIKDPNKPGFYKE